MATENVVLYQQYQAKDGGTTSPASAHRACSNKYLESTEKREVLTCSGRDIREELTAIVSVKMFGASFFSNKRQACFFRGKVYCGVVSFGALDEYL